jgi:hypothetical protein
MHRAVASSSGSPTDLRLREFHSGSHQPKKLRSRCSRDTTRLEGPSLSEGMSQVAKRYRKDKREARSRPEVLRPAHDARAPEAGTYAQLIFRDRRPSRLARMRVPRGSWSKTAGHAGAIGIAASGKLQETRRCLLHVRRKQDQVKPPVLRLADAHEADRRAA